MMQISSFEWFTTDFSKWVGAGLIRLDSNHTLVQIEFERKSATDPWVCSFEVNYHMDAEGNPGRKPKQNVYLFHIKNLVIEGLVSFVNKTNPKTIKFRAREENRRRLYNRAVKCLPNYTVDSLGSNFILSRIE